MKCPFEYANGKECQGYIERIKIVKPDIEINLNADSEGNENPTIISVKIQRVKGIYLEIIKAGTTIINSK